MSVLLETIRYRTEQCACDNGFQRQCYLLAITVGLSGARTIRVVASRRDTFSDIARTMKIVLEPAQQRADIQFVDANSTVLRMSALVSKHREAELSSEPTVLTAVFLPSWQFKLLALAPQPRMCDCLRHTCCWNVWGKSITINANSDPPVYKRGAITPIREFTRHIKSNEWDPCYRWHPPGYDINKLCEKTDREYMWSCRNCDKVAIVALESCIPDDPQHCCPWQNDLPALSPEDVPTQQVWCGECFVNYYDTERRKTTSSLAATVNAIPP